MDDFQNNAFPPAVLSIIALPILLKVVGSGAITGKCSKRQGFKGIPVIGSMEAIGHTAIGFSAGVAMSPLYMGTNADWFVYLRSIIALLIAAVYPLYNLWKRNKKHGRVFFQSSFFINLMDVFVGMLAGYVFGVAWYKSKQSKKKAFVVQKYIRYTMYSMLGLWLVVVLAKMASTKNVTTC
jgi:hypothetical protein